MDYPLVAPYISTEDFRKNSGGLVVDTSVISDDELTEILLSASEMCNTETDSHWGYKEIHDEPHPWNVEKLHASWQVDPSYAPVRTITGFKIFVSNTNTGESVVATVPVAPAGPAAVVAAGQYPYNFGLTYVNREEEWVASTFALLQWGIFGAWPTKIVDPPQVFLSYTAGYDYPNIPSGDGYIFPIPSWLREATRLIAIEIIGQRTMNAQGLTGIVQGRQGDVAFRRAMGKEGIPSIIPDGAARILRRHHRTTLQGA